MNDSEHIPLLRGGCIVSSLSGALGRSLKETRLTAMLGYLIALAPERFLKSFHFDGTMQSVSLESNDSQGRSDILVETAKGRGVIEAKIDGSNPHKQAEHCVRLIATLRISFRPVNTASRDTHSKKKHYIKTMFVTEKSDCNGRI